MAFILIACDGGVLDHPVYALHLAIGPGMLDLSEAVFNPVFLTAQVEHMGDVRGRQSSAVETQTGCCCLSAPWIV